MKPCSAALAALIESGSFVDGVGDPGTPFVPFDLYTITLTDGSVLSYTTADFPIAAPAPSIFSAPRVFGPSGDVWPPGMVWSPAVIDAGGTRSTGHWKAGLDSDTWNLRVTPRPLDVVTGAKWPDRINGVPWLVAVKAGVLDSADVIVSRAYFAELPRWPVPIAGAVPVGTLIIFRGVVGEIDLSTASASITVSDYKSVLNQQMPRNLYQASCRHQLFDARCSLRSVDFTRIGVTLAGTTSSRIVASVQPPAGSETWTLGVLTMTSGLNAGSSRLVSRWDGSDGFTLLSPFQSAVDAGETFSITPGCDKQMSTCTKFGNLMNFGGNPHIPAPETSL